MLNWGMRSQNLLANETSYDADTLKRDGVTKGSEGQVVRSGYADSCIFVQVGLVTPNERSSRRELSTVAIVVSLNTDRSEKNRCRPPHFN